MKAKNFKDYLAKHLNQSEIAELEKQADIELEAIKRLQEDTSAAVAKYMAHERIGFKKQPHIILNNYDTNRPPYPSRTF
jgi:hypothetical protein